MKQVKAGDKLQLPAIGIGCMRLGSLDGEQLQDYIRYCVDHGLNFFDHADIYGGGECERAFGQALKDSGIDRSEVILQSKCGIVPGKMYNFDRQYILDSVDGILERLQSDYLDILLLHRPDALMEPEEVATAFSQLEASGKVRRFGVSNFRPMQIELLQKSLKQPLIINQMQFSLPSSTMIQAGFETNMPTEGAVDRDGQTIEYCRLKDILLQTWSPFQYGDWEGVFIGNREKFPALNEKLEELAVKYDAAPTALAAAWILRHPAGMQLIAGTTRKERLAEIIRGSEIDLSREDWYALYMAAGHRLP